MTFLFVFFFTFWAQADPHPRPTQFVVTQSSGKHRDIQLVSMRHGAQRFLTQTPVEETALFCREKRVFFVAGEQIQMVKLDQPKQETTLGQLPKEFVAAMGSSLRHFLRFSDDGSYLAWPGSSDIQIRKIDATFQKSIHPEPGSRIVHPVFWRPGAAEILYLTQNQTGAVTMHFHALDQADPRLNLVAIARTQGTVSAFDLHFSLDGKIAAINMDIAETPRKTVRYFLVVDAETGNVHTLNPSWKLEKFHGFSKKGELVLTGRISGRTALYYWNPSNPKNPHQVEVLHKREVVDYFPALDITLLFTSGTKCADRPRLISLSRLAQDRRLLKWAEWAEVLAMDTHRVWGIFRAGGTCVDTRPALYLMKMDGTGLLKEMPRAKFSMLHAAPPEQVAICE